MTHCQQSSFGPYKDLNLLGKQHFIVSTVLVHVLPAVGLHCQRTYWMAILNGHSQDRDQETKPTGILMTNCFQNSYGSKYQFRKKSLKQQFMSWTPKWLVFSFKAWYTVCKCMTECLGNEFNTLACTSITSSSGLCGIKNLSAKNFRFCTAAHRISLKRTLLWW